MQHVNSLSLRDADRLALDHARALWDEHANGPRLDEGAGGEGGEGSEGGEGAGGEGGEGGGPDLTQQALDAIANLQKTGAQIPDALTAAVTELKNARGEAATYRTKLRDVESKQGQHDEVLQGIAKALGLAQDDDPDPQQLQTKVAEQDSTIKTQTVELAAYRAAPKHQADAAALLDSRSFITAAAKLDPTGDKFGEELDALIKDAVEKNPKLKVGQAPPVGGADSFSGGSGEGQKATDLTGALANHYST